MTRFSEKLRRLVKKEGDNNPGFNHQMTEAPGPINPEPAKKQKVPYRRPHFGRNTK